MAGGLKLGGRGVETGWQGGETGRQAHHLLPYFIISVLSAVERERERKRYFVCGEGKRL